MKTLDKYEYNVKLDQMKSLCADENYEAAAEIADSINWNKIKNVNALFRTGEIYEKIGRYEDARDVLLMAYDRSPIGRMIVYRLAEVAIKMSDFDGANEYYREFVEIAPHDNLKYVLRYNIKKAQGADIGELIAILEEFKEVEYTEEWSYELAYLYHRAGMSDKCIEACDELILWFGDGPYVERALELKMLYQPLTKSQEEKYRTYRRQQAGVTDIVASEMEKAGEFGHGSVSIPQVKAGIDKFNTTNLQQEIARGMQQIMEATEKETVSDTMETIKKMVEEIPYLQLPREEETVTEEVHIETDEEIDGSLKINFQELIGEDHDGQMSLMVEDSNVEKQITGQMSIEDVLEEWEKTKHAAEQALQEAQQRKLESAKARALQEAEELMDRLQDVIPKLDAGVTPRELLEEEYLQREESVSDEIMAQPIENTEQLLNRQKVEAGKMFQDMNELLGKEIQRLTEEVGTDSAAGELAPQEITEEASATHEMIEETSATHEMIEEAFATEEITEEASAPQEIMEEVLVAQDDVKEIYPDPVEPEVISEVRASVVSQNAESEQPEKIRIEEIGKTRRLPDLEHLTKQNILTQKTVRMPDLSEALEEKEEKEETTKENQKKMTALSKELKSVFSYFVPVKGMEDQLCQALSGTIEHLSKDENAGRGNLIIQGGKACGKTVLATSVIKALQKEIGKPSGKVGKISGDALNKKDVAQLLKKVAGGCLIIESASAMSRETAVSLSFLLEHDASGVFIILEDTTVGIKKVLSYDEGLSKIFSEKITVPTFNNDELVAFGKSYARELGYEIDEMAVLALYNRISNIQRLDQDTTLTEVKSIVDSAIEASEKGGLKKAFSMLTSKRYTEDNKIILRERDFEVV
ncbi:MAG: hypothetical protein MR356_04365 [Agathobacter sp.]|nr:hypothetical protein [Agathobacter sp.]